ncbi:MAG: YdbL family protein [Mariprofundaceae bacterium]|nr:YdbL family protein [Mariprofundaceae bacterium]
MTLNLKNYARAIFLLLSFTLYISAAHAITLQEAKSSGAVGERGNGYIGIVAQSSPAIQALVKKVNQQRKSKYQNIAKSNNTTLKSIETLAGKKTLQKTPSGQFIQKSGRWLKK